MRGPVQSIAVGAAVAAIVMLAAGLADRYAAHGLTAEWRQRRDDALHTVTTTVEHRTRFPNQHRALARYIQGWPFDAWGIPRHDPRLDARLSGTLHVPGDAPRHLQARSPQETDLYVDGRLTTPEELVGPGVHRFDLSWRGRFSDRTRLTLQWAPRGAAFEPIPDTAFTPRGGPWTPLRVALWSVAAALALLLGTLAHAAARAPTHRARRRRWAALATVTVVLLALGYRSFDYDVMPEFRENYDELFATWNGWSLLAEGRPRGWSLWPHRYGGRVDVEPLHYFSPRSLGVIEPYFEHPPLLHLMVGAVAHLGGASHWSHARLEHTRLVPIFLGGLTTLLLVLIGRRLGRRRHTGALLGGLLYAVLPMIALQGRVIKEEALLAPMALGSLLFFLRWRDDGERTADLLGAAILAGAATLAKVPGAVFAVALVMLLLQRGRTREAVLAGGVAALAASPLLVYAAVIDWDVFWFTTLHQATGRPSHWNLFPRFFDDPLINHNLVGRPWLLFLWLGWALSLRGLPSRDRAVMVVPPVLYILGIGLSSGNWTFGWYMMPVYPFLCLGAGRFLAELWDRPALLGGVLLMTLAVMYGVNFVRDLDEWKAAPAWPETRRAVTLFLVVALAPYALAQVWRARPVRLLARAATAAGLAAVVVLSGWFVVHYESIYETHRNFDRLEFFDR